METRDHSKNGASLKSHTSKGNLMYIMKNKVFYFSMLLFAAMIFTGCKKTLSVSPTSITFAGNETTKTVTVITNAANWEFTPAPDWLSLEKQGKTTLNISVNSTSKEKRTASIVFTAGSAVPATLQITQEKFSFTDIVESPYKGTGTPMSAVSKPAPTTWTGRVAPRYTTQGNPYYAISNWANQEDYVFCDFIDGEIILDTYTYISSSSYNWFFRAFYFTGSTSLYIIPSANKEVHTINHNIFSKTFDFFSGTVNGYPVYFGFLAYNKSTGAFAGSIDEPSIYTKPKLVLTTTVSSSASQFSQQLIHYDVKPNNIVIDESKLEKIPLNDLKHIDKSLLQSVPIKK